VTRGFRRYPEYRDTGVEWLAEVPVHWGVQRLKAVASIRYGLGQPPRESKHGPPLIRATNINNGRIVQNDLIHVDPSDVPVSREPFLKRSEIIVVRSGAYTADSAIVREPYVGAIAGYDMVVSVTGADPEFIAIALLSKYVRHDQLIAASTRSAQPHLNAEELGSALLVLPPRPEQAAIADYLGRQMGAIGRLVRKKVRLIELLNEERASLISEAVTRGLDPEVPTRDSGVEWLGEIPAHWGVVRLKDHVAMNQLVLPDDTDPDYTFDYVDIGSVDTGRLGSDLKAIPFGSSPSRARRVVRPGDTLVSTVRTYLKAVWTPGQLERDLIASTGFAVLTPGPDTVADYFGYFCQSDPFTDAVSAGSVGIAYPAITEAALGCVPTCAPPLPEQRAIADFLDRETGRIDALVAKTREAIKRLREYRGSVISAGVTGQIDLRESMLAS